MTRRDDFTNLLKMHGYTSVNNFCIENKFNQGNVATRLRDESIKIELPLLFTWANILGEPIDTLINIFYPKEYATNQAIAKENKKRGK